MDKPTKTHAVIWALVLAVFWLFLSGFLKPLLLAFGLISVVLVVYLIKRMDTSDDEPQKPALSFAFFRYVFWLIGQIILSSIEVTKLVWGNSKNLSPSIAKLPINSTPDQSRVLYANSITLTPGTLSVDIDQDHITVHALKAQSIQELQAGEMAKKVSSVTGAKN